MLDQFENSLAARRGRSRRCRVRLRCSLLRFGIRGRPVLDPKALHGLAGQMVEKILSTTEADPVALLIQTLTTFGSVIGRGPHFIVEETPHYTNLNSMLVGSTSLGREGTSASRILAPFRYVDEQWYLLRIANGLSSGEGLIKEVRDPLEKWDNKKNEMVLVDEGVEDKRLLVLETEFSMPLVNAKRLGNNLFRVVRELWDGKEVIRTLVSQSPQRATGAHVSIVGHITRDELLKEIDTTALMNGVVNRFLLALIGRSKELPFGGENDEDTTRELGEKIGELVNVMRRVGRVGMNDKAREIFKAAYHDLSAERPGLFGGAVARGAPQVRRLAMIYALLDRKDEVEAPHLEAALALWQYCLASAEILFGCATGDQNADMIGRALRTAGPAGMSRSDISNLFGRHLPAHHIDAALTVLVTHAKARPDCRRQGHFAVPIWVAT
jgi:hypothetical protein